MSAVPLVLSEVGKADANVSCPQLPMVEKSAARRWGKDPAYQAYLRDTSAVIPWFRKENGT